jgi:hypothetical protein
VQNALSPVTGVPHFVQKLAMTLTLSFAMCRAAGNPPEAL